ncbi:hypothetical protein [Pragia fontium]|uniref:Uncharacterized protein n=2 Tax=Pragia fontium TaxID=82985 RepID=A0AAJ4W8Y7_9GAMM|nr:hypothetical protein [Pragia fontium]AKJ41834.1 hypothetical protein QQ39_06835 [Pragia fontium]SFC36581.1 hypothetical protein SAMN02745723_102186 [Pragia fontium DSM 5563 = ATCC 49100]SUB82053.1 Uncharacterised protein [Pragia fontium]VEJ54677.1 Uncharacterised protein [Pragia fontium]GKX62149.1 hypothetical protein SOASR032_07180 [Pragia fontium]
MKVLSETEIQQVSGAGLFGSALGAFGFKTVGKKVNDFENKIIEFTLGKIPLVGSSLINLLKDPFGAFKDTAK